ncbi:hypothetical protein [Ectobacillus ponti]|uniref:Uncharacterized protein n=1 Tax=Ectobacillus ponti TaxID=2961894 RepID=A0AA41X7N7_9BACI|nr:hypothetical protein [Ectobacillus ponti]MCP8967830.1 hypothetical protein [Ectobacillus ponti]
MEKKLFGVQFIFSAGYVEVIRSGKNEQEVINQAEKEVLTSPGSALNVGENIFSLRTLLAIKAEELTADSNMIKVVSGAIKAMVAKSQP